MLLNLFVNVFNKLRWWTITKRQSGLGRGEKKTSCTDWLLCTWAYGAFDCYGIVCYLYVTLYAVILFYRANNAAYFDGGIYGFVNSLYYALLFARK